MPRRFSAPIPVHNTFGRPRDIGKEDVVDYIVEMWHRGTDRGGGPGGAPALHLLITQGYSLDDSIYHRYRRLLIARGLAGCIQELVRRVERAVTYGNVFDVDDYFMVYTNPNLLEEMEGVLRTVEAIKSVPDGSTKQGMLRIWRETIGLWMERRVGQQYPTLRPESVTDALALRETTPLCWHSQTHERFKGRRQRVRRRACAWGTYVLAWLLGGETLAVQLWNQLVGAELQWGHPSDSGYALAKYWDAKKRLIDDLRDTAGQKIVPGRVSVVPNPPLEPDIIPLVEAISRALLGKVTMEEMGKRLWG